MLFACAREWVVSHPGALIALSCPNFSLSLEFERAGGPHISSAGEREGCGLCADLCTCFTSAPGGSALRRHPVVFLARRLDMRFHLFLDIPNPPPLSCAAFQDALRAGAESRRRVRRHAK